jgi:NhaA family Na+:H+ antiporter
MADRRPTTTVLRQLLTGESAGGLVLMAAALLALIVANSPLAPAYFGALATYVAGLSLLHWINDLLMAAFFLLVGLEIKREFLDGQLATWPRRLLPGIAAVGGMIVPALIYVAFNLGTGGELKGWAIASATDIAFALGVMALLGSRVPVSLKIFLTALAILDDLGAILIIAVFYTASLAFGWLGLAALMLVALVVLNRTGVTRLAPYLALGLVLWFAVLQSGIHATLAGVALALTIPLNRSRGHADDTQSPLHTLEHALSPWVAYLVLPVFGFANAGLSFAGMSAAAFVAPVTLGIAAGLFLGKQVGVFLAVLVPAKLKLVERPAGATWPQVYGMALLCGIGFTMSIFIGLLAFPLSPLLQDELKVGVLMGSLLSGIAGALVLVLARPARPAANRAP